MYLLYVLIIICDVKCFLLKFMNFSQYFEHFYGVFLTSALVELRGTDNVQWEMDEMISEGAAASSEKSVSILSQ